MKVNLVLKKEESFTGIFRYVSSLYNTLFKEKNLELKCVQSTGGKFFKNYPFILTPKPKKQELVHFSDQILALPLLWSKYERSVVTVHDLIFLVKPELWKKAPHLKWKILDKVMYHLSIKSLRKAKRIIAVSEHTKKDLVKLVGYPREKIDVTYEGVNTKFKRIVTKHNGFVVLYVGSEIPTKNLPILFKAFAMLKKRLHKAKLIKVGSPQWKGAREDLVKLIKELRIEQDVKFKGYVKDLVLEYNRADLFVFPSLYEGFGLPVLEAMACGCPVVCSNATSLPEVGGDAVLYFNPNDSKELADKMYKVLTDEKLRKKLIKKGLRRAKQFTWKKTAQKTVEVYKKVLEDSK